MTLSHLILFLFFLKKKLFNYINHFNSIAIISNLFEFLPFNHLIKMINM